MSDNIAKEDLKLILEAYKSQTESNYVLLEHVKHTSLKLDQVIEMQKSSCIMEKMEQINNLLNQLSDLRHVITESCRNSEVSVNNAINEHSTWARQSANNIEMNFLKLKHIMILQYTAIAALFTNIIIPILKNIFNSGY
jgi:hypothetical protein